MERSIAIAMAPLAALLGWLLAEHAARPGWRAGVASAVGFALAAVVLGAFAVAALVQLAGGSGPGEVVAGTILFRFLGLGLLGLPVFLLAFPMALIWVVAVRVGIRVLRVHA
jgi:hypothetical protein